MAPLSLPSPRPPGALSPLPDRAPLDERPEPAERYRALRALVDADAAGATTRALLLVGVDGDVAAPATMLAIAIALAGRSTVLVDANLRRSAGAEDGGIAARLHVSTPPGRSTSGLAEWLSVADESGDGPGAISLPAFPTDVPNLLVVPPGVPRRAAGDLLGGERLTRLVPALRRDHQRIVVAVPPLALVADALPFARLVDAVLLVVAPGRTSGPAAIRARDTLQSAGGRILGVVLDD